MNIDISVLSTDLKEEAGKIYLGPEGEELLIKLLELQAKVQEAIDEAERVLAEEGSAMNPNFSSIQADKIKVYYRAYGSRFYLDMANKDLAPKELYTEEIVTKYKIDSKAVEKWIDEKGGMPAGINEAERTKSLKFSLKKNAKSEDES